MTVTVCVPVWNGASFVAETLESLRHQTLTDFRVLISVDRSDDDSVAICRAYESDPRFVVTVQPERLGWIGNVNSLLARVETPLGCITPHDDLIAPDYLRRLVTHLEEHPSAVLAFSDLETFGPREHIVVQPDLIGNRLDRIVTFLHEHDAAVGWRGVFRSVVLARGRFHREEPKADTLWLLELACEGDLVRVPDVLYRKRLHKNSARNQPAWTMPSKHVSWIDHCVACYDVAMAAAEWTGPERQRIAAAALARALRFNDMSAATLGTLAGVENFVSVASHFSLRVAGAIPRGSSPLRGEASAPQRPEKRRKRKRGMQANVGAMLTANSVAPQGFEP